MALKQRQAILEEMRVLMGNTTVFTLTLETTLHSLNCHWGQQYTLYTVTVHYTTFFTLSQETTIHWCPAEGAVLVDPGGDRSGMVWLCVVIVVWCWGVCLYYCDVERDCPQADGDEPAGDWASPHDSVRDVLVNKKSYAMLSPRMFHLYLSISC